MPLDTQMTDRAQSARDQQVWQQRELTALDVELEQEWRVGRQLRARFEQKAGEAHAAHVHVLGLASIPP